MNQQITFLSDGGESVREVQLYLNPQAEHWLDWFHITMRLTVMKQMAKSLKWAEDESEEDPIEGPELSERAVKEIKRIKWFLWHGNVVRALDSIEEVEDMVACAQAGEASSKLQKAIDEFHTYIENNAERILNFGERRRNGEKVSTAFVESTVNQVISKRMVKKQQMRWSRRGAHLLLQVRTQELNGDLRSMFDRWNSGCDQEAEKLEKVA